GVTFRATQASVSGVDVGTVGAVWTSAGDARVDLGFGATDPSAAPVTASIATRAVPPTARITLPPTDLGKLAAPLDVKLPPGVMASGPADLVFPKGLEPGNLTGHIASRLDGFVPPHPVELDGFLFGSTTLFSTDVDVSADRTSVDLRNTRVQ